MLSQKTIDIVKSTAPVIVEAGPMVTQHFYKRLFREYPDLQNIFNMSHQNNNQTNTPSNQQVALFNAICAYAKISTIYPSYYQWSRKLLKSIQVF